MSNINNRFCDAQIILDFEHIFDLILKIRGNRPPVLYRDSL